MEENNKTRFILEKDDLAVIVRGNGDEEIFMPKIFGDTGDYVENKKQSTLLKFLILINDDSEEANKIKEDVEKFFND